MRLSLINLFFKYFSNLFKNLTLNNNSIINYFLQHLFYRCQVDLFKALYLSLDSVNFLVSFTNLNL